MEVGQQTTHTCFSQYSFSVNLKDVEAREKITEEGTVNV